jgi:hypothetical protein
VSSTLAVVWILLAISPDKTFVGGLAREYVAVFASAEACDAERRKMDGAADSKWVCERETVQH